MMMTMTRRTAGRPFNNDEEKEEEEENEEDDDAFIDNENDTCNGNDDEAEGEEDHGEEEDDSIDDMAMPVMLPLLLIARDDGYAADDDGDDKYDEQYVGRAVKRGTMMLWMMRTLKVAHGADDSNGDEWR